MVYHERHIDILQSLFVHWIFYLFTPVLYSFRFIQESFIISQLEVKNISFSERERERESLDIFDTRVDIKKKNEIGSFGKSERAS